MKTKKLEVGKTPSPTTSTTNILKVLYFFQLEIGTSLDCAIALGILRNSITYYIRDLEKKNLLKSVFVDKDRTTRHKAKHYSADPIMWACYNVEVSDSDNGKEVHHVF